MRRLSVLAASLIGLAAQQSMATNIVVILADDLGYGDTGCYGATKINTPNIDRIAAEGLRFTSGYAPASVCTPSRYGLITGMYAWRNPAGARILPGDAPLSIRPGSATLPQVLRDAGYATGVVGKWHLGLGEEPGKQDWNGEVKPGPLEVGFSYSFIIPATGDRVPCVFVENHRVVGAEASDPIRVSYAGQFENEPTGYEPRGIALKLKPLLNHDQAIVNGISRIGFMTGGEKARWVDEKIPEVLTQKAVSFIEQHQREPFFLYFAPHDIHAPRVPSERFRGKSACGIRGDVVEQLDWQVGQVMETLDRLKLTEDTLLIFASDNGGTTHNGYADGGTDGQDGHAINGPLRGEKSSLYEGGLRVPFIARWPKVIKAGATTDAVACLLDLKATCGEIAKREPGETDGVSLMTILRGDKIEARKPLVLQSNMGRRLAIRKGGWKYIEAGPGARGQGRAPEELYDLASDLAEAHNVAAQQTDVVKELRAELAAARGK